MSQDDDLRALEREAMNAAPAVMRYLAALSRAGLLPAGPVARAENEELAVLRRLVTILPALSHPSGPAWDVALDPDVRRLAAALHSLLRGPQGLPGNDALLQSPDVVALAQVREIVRQELDARGVGR